MKNAKMKRKKIVVFVIFIIIVGIIFFSSIDEAISPDIISKSAPIMWRQVQNIGMQLKINNFYDPINTNIRPLTLRGNRNTPPPADQIAGQITASALMRGIFSSYLSNMVYSTLMGSDCTTFSSDYIKHETNSQFSSLQGKGDNTIDIERLYADMDRSSVDLSGVMMQIDDITYQYTVTIEIFPVYDSDWNIWLQNSCDDQHQMIYKVQTPYSYPIHVLSFATSNAFYVGGVVQQLTNGDSNCEGTGNICRYNQICVQTISRSSFNGGNEYCTTFPIDDVTNFPGHEDEKC